MNILRLTSDADELDIIVYTEDLAASLGLDVLLSDIFAFVVEEAMTVSAPSHASHVNFVLFRLFTFLAWRTLKVHWHRAGVHQARSHLWISNWWLTRLHRALTAPRVLFVIRLALVHSS